MDLQEDEIKMLVDAKQIPDVINKKPSFKMDEVVNQVPNDIQL
jgi:hypothetical protein